MKIVASGMLLLAFFAIEKGVATSPRLALYFLMILS